LICNPNKPTESDLLSLNQNEEIEAIISISFIHLFFNIFGIGSYIIFIKAAG